MTVGEFSEKREKKNKNKSFFVADADVIGLSTNALFFQFKFDLIFMGVEVVNGERQQNGLVSKGKKFFFLFFFFSCYQLTVCRRAGFLLHHCTCSNDIGKILK